MKDHSLKPLWSVPVIVAALGYFVDIYDLLLFSIVRRTSLQSIGVPEDQLLTQGEFVLQSQMVGLLLGGLIWGIMGDKKGRLSVLFGSILLYSLANIANGFVTTVNQYAVLRFIGGIGLAGELGAGITLVSEVLPTRLRGYGTTLVATVGLMGAVLANFIAKKFDWQIAYFIGGGLGIVLLVARVSIFESGVFLKLKEQTVQRGNFFQLFSNSTRFKKFVGSVFIGLPIWFVIGILITFSPEFAKALHIDGTISAGDAVMYSYIGLAVGDLVSGFISQALRSRKKVVFLYVIVTTVMILVYLFTPGRSVFNFYLTCFLLGVSIGYWALFVTMAAEQFGTNLRSTVATSAPNFIRGMVVPLTLGFRFMREQLGGGEPAVIYGALVVGVITIIIAFLSLQWVEETFSRDMNFVEEDR
ncbi:MAG: MFS transporter [Cytophagales bacterium]|jgi:putative MFS transporter|nr:MFS transporter [Cytophagales bacterium]MCA6387456.1 MFS transporter [Cytophagales bacterium]MCA6393138.1 MFS transporter [Cytophagales bacterium]MCA6396179.1 MFS transporter [Cytophagales bacterium]MCA6397350.1 MFS transporter [Cytophagales bacterium]